MWVVWKDRCWQNERFFSKGRLSRTDSNKPSSPQKMQFLISNSKSVPWFVVPHPLRSITYTSQKTSPIASNMPGSDAERIGVEAEGGKLYILEWYAAPRIYGCAGVFFKFGVEDNIMQNLLPIHEIQNRELEVLKNNDQMIYRVAFRIWFQLANVMKRSIFKTMATCHMYRLKDLKAFCKIELKPCRQISTRLFVDYWPTSVRRLGLGLPSGLPWTSYRFPPKKEIYRIDLIATNPLNQNILYIYFKPHVEFHPIISHRSWILHWVPETSKNICSICVFSGILKNGPTWRSRPSLPVSSWRTTRWTCHDWNRTCHSFGMEAVLSILNF